MGLAALDILNYVKRATESPKVANLIKRPTKFPGGASQMKYAPKKEPSRLKISDRTRSSPGSPISYHGTAAELGHRKTYMSNPPLKPEEFESKTKVIPKISNEEAAKKLRSRTNTVSPSTQKPSEFPGHAAGQKFTAREALNNPSINQMLAGAGPSKRSAAEIEAIKRRGKANDPFTTGKTVDISHVGKPRSSAETQKLVTVQKGVGFSGHPGSEKLPKPPSSTQQRKMDLEDAQRLAEAGQHDKAAALFNKHGINYDDPRKKGKR